MARNIYITAIEGHAGKSTVALGLLDTLSHEAERLGAFRPVAVIPTNEELEIARQTDATIRP